MMGISSKISIRNHRHGRLTEKSIPWGNWRIIVSQEIERYPDRHVPFTIYHSGTVPVFKVSNRKIIFETKVGDALSKLTLRVKAWRGDYIARAAITLGIVNDHYPQELSKDIRGLKQLSLSEAYQIKPMRKLSGRRELYERTFLGKTMDYVVRDAQKVTFHAATVKEAKAGLARKVEAMNLRPAMKGRITARRALTLGFCLPGIEQFCDDLKLDIESSYTITEICACLEGSHETARKYKGELNTLARAFCSDRLSRLMRKIS